MQVPGGVSSRAWLVSCPGPCGKWMMDGVWRVVGEGRGARGENPSLSLSLGPGPANTMLWRCMLCHQMLLASVGTTQNQSGTGDRRSVWAFDAVISLLGRTGRPAGRIHAAKYMCACCMTTSDWAGVVAVLGLLSSQKRRGRLSPADK